MKISTLKEYEIPDVLIQAWESAQGDKLLPLQERAIRERGLLGSRSLVISAPTSSGKTFCGELAAAGVLAKRQKVVFLVPLKALAEEQYYRFKQRYEPLGLRVRISTRDHRDMDTMIERGEFDLAVIIYEKLNQMLLRNLDILGSIDLLVVDELQMLGDDSRGAVLEMILLKTLRSSYDCRLLGLSAVLGNASELASWLDADLLVESHRPVELRQGVLLDDTFSFRCFNSRERGTETMVDMTGMPPGECLLGNAAELVKNGEQVLVFLKSKGSCAQLAAMLAEELAYPLCEAAIAELAAGEETALREALINVIRSGIAFHHADLTHRERSIIEKYYLEGGIRIIFATTTLSLGLNLPARTVFLETYRYRLGSYTGEPVVEGLSWNDYENMCGRAGRLKLGGEFGRSIVVAGSELESEMLWKSFICGGPGSLNGQLFRRDLADLVIDAVVSGCAHDHDSLVRYFESALSDTPEEIETGVRKTIRSLCESELLVESGENLVPSLFGSRLSQLGISASTGIATREILGSGCSYPDMFWLMYLCNTVEGLRIHVNRFTSEEATRHCISKFRASMSDCENLPDIAAMILENPARISPRMLSRMRLALALYDWMRGAELVEIEREYGILSGTIHSAGETLGWLAEGVACLMGTLNVSRKQRIQMRRMSFEVSTGVPVQMRKVFALLKPHVSRNSILRMRANGVKSIRDLRNLGKEAFLQFVGSEKLEVVMKSLVERNGSVISRKSGGCPESGASLKMTGGMVRDRFKVFYRGTPLLLTAKSFKYLFKLAAQMKIDGQGWIDKERLEPGFNQARYLYNLKRELGTDQLIENNRRGSYRITLPPNEIWIDLPTLSSMEDYEIAELSGLLMAQ